MSDDSIFREFRDREGFCRRVLYERSFFERSFFQGDFGREEFFREEFGREEFFIRGISVSPQFEYYR